MHLCIFNSAVMYVYIHYLLHYCLFSLMDVTYNKYVQELNTVKYEHALYMLNNLCNEIK